MPRVSDGRCIWCERPMFGNGQARGAWAPDCGEKVRADELRPGDVVEWNHDWVRTLEAVRLLGQGRLRLIFEDSGSGDPEVANGTQVKVLRRAGFDAEREGVRVLVPAENLRPGDVVLWGTGEPMQRIVESVRADALPSGAGLVFVVFRDHHDAERFPSAYLVRVLFRRPEPEARRINARAARPATVELPCPPEPADQLLDALADLLLVRHQVGDIELGANATAAEWIARGYAALNDAETWFEGARAILLGPDEDEAAADVVPIGVFKPGSGLPMARGRRLRRAGSLIQIELTAVFENRPVSFFRKLKQPIVFWVRQPDTGKGEPVGFQASQWWDLHCPDGGRVLELAAVSAKAEV